MLRGGGIWANCHSIPNVNCTTATAVLWVQILSFFSRLEMYTRSRTDLHATKGTTFIYAWWFDLSSQIIADTSYWHIFQVVTFPSLWHPVTLFDKKKCGTEFKQRKLIKLIFL